MRGFLLLSALLTEIAIAAQLHGQRIESNASELKAWPSDLKAWPAIDKILDRFRGRQKGLPVQQKLKNNFDVQYTAHIDVGGQPISTVLDSGSFELLVFSEHCVLCGATHGLYNDKRSKTFDALDFIGEHSFGSGTTRSNEAFEVVKLGGGKIKSERQHFWEVIDADMAILEDDFFHAILGIGPPRSAEKFARMNADQIHTEYDTYKDSHDGEVPNAMWDEVQHYDDAVAHAKNASSITEEMDVSDVSVCLGRAPGSDGVFVWNDDAPVHAPDKFRTINVDGDIYWSAKLTNVKMGGVGAGSDASMGCGDSSCSAVLDTGTSLIVAPPAAIQKVQDLLDNWIDPTGNCSDLSGLPNLEFEMGGVTFALPPDAYVGRVDGEASMAIQEVMPHLTFEKKRKKASIAPTCVPLLMASEADTQFGDLWILGMPFFRTYYTTFHFADHGSQAKAVSFARASHDCRPADDVALRVQTRAQREHPTKVTPLSLKASKLRAPRWMPRPFQVTSSARLKVEPQSLLTRAKNSTRPFVHV